MRFPKHAGDGDSGGDPRDAEALAAVGLGAFAQLALPEHPPEGLGLAAAYDDASGHISVSFAGATVSASRADLAAALELPPGPVGLAAGVSAAAATFSSAEAIAAVSAFVRDRMIRGGGGDGGPASGEVAAALQLVEEGKGFEVDWGGLVWAVVKEEVVAGTLQRCTPYLLRLMENQRPELFVEFDVRLSPQKRWKGCQWTDGMLLGSEYLDLEQEDASLVYGGSQNVGDLEDMPIFGEVKDVPCVGGDEIHALNQGNVEFGPGNFSALDGSSDKQDDYLNSQQVMPMSQSDPDAGLPLVRNVPLGTSMSQLSQLQEVGGVCNYQALSPFQACLRQVQGYLPAMEGAYFNVEKACRDTERDVKHLKKVVIEKDHLIAAMKSDIREELRGRSEIHLHEQSLVQMRSAVEQQKMLVKKSLAEFQEYRIMCGEGVGGQNPVWLQQVHEKISGVDRNFSMNVSELLKKTTEMEMGVAKLNHEVQRLKDSKSIPDLNNGKAQI
ncbi:hypothetical protein HU200_055060 [Digitaria exilis]|uniref:Uncharacterized protein n=1 Tax=Digitaria exilis TaxID=1010633 RepID=A0A835AJ75_9POAL|nr:hypothetical protein HU200_055060 [Digitaria exilis]